jgi:hypothetical protein
MRIGTGELIVFAQMSTAAWNAACACGCPLNPTYSTEKVVAASRLLLIISLVRSPTLGPYE